MEREKRGENPTVAGEGRPDTIIPLKYVRLKKSIIHALETSRVYLLGPEIFLPMGCVKLGN